MGRPTTVHAVLTAHGRSVWVCARAVSILWLASCISNTQAGAQVPWAFDWKLRDRVEQGVEQSPIPHPGHDWPADHQVYHDLFDDLLRRGWPIGIMLQNDTGPVYGTKDPLALERVLGYVPRLDFAFADFEDQYHEANTQEMIRQVRACENPLVSSADIGNYADYPGSPDLSYPYPDQSDRTARDEFYRSSGLTVAMPGCYPYEYYEMHASGAIWGEYVSPNERAALFWAPLARFSLAVSELPRGHRVIPWIAGFIAWNGYDAEPPTAEDREALLVHMRLRGADGYYTLISGIDGYSDEQYRDDMLTVWHSLDWLFNTSEHITCLNLETNKQRGIEWSGVYRRAVVVFEISNLNDVPVSIDLPDLSGVPDWSPEVGPYAHVMLTYWRLPQADQGAELTMPSGFEPIP